MAKGRESEPKVKYRYVHMTWGKFSWLALSVQHCCSHPSVA